MKLQAMASDYSSIKCRKSVASFFAAYDVLCEEGTATSVCRALDEVADISVPGKVFHLKCLSVSWSVASAFSMNCHLY